MYVLGRRRNGRQCLPAHVFVNEKKKVNKNQQYVSNENLFQSMSMLKRLKVCRTGKMVETLRVTQHFRSFAALPNLLVSVHRPIY